MSPPCPSTEGSCHTGSVCRGPSFSSPGSPPPAPWELLCDTGASSHLEQGSRQALPVARAGRKLTRLQSYRHLYQSPVPGAAPWGLCRTMHQCFHQCHTPEDTQWVAVAYCWLAVVSIRKQNLRPGTIHCPKRPAEQDGRMSTHMDGFIFSQ